MVQDTVPKFARKYREILGGSSVWVENNINEIRTGCPPPPDGYTIPTCTVQILTQ
jgi:hypothetical protein